MEITTPIIVPVLIIAFNRPSIFRKCIETIRESRPTNLYFACDGARDHKDGEDKLVAEVRSIMENEIDWPCDKHFRYNDKNKGCEITESEAITWVLEEMNNDYVIVVEDDIIAPYSFLKFAQEMLFKYKDDEKIYQVTSDNVTPMPFPNNEDYCFSIHGHIWGWATWRRAWKHFDLYLDDWDVTAREVVKRDDLSDEEKQRLISLCNNLKSRGKGNSTWDIVWSYVKWRDGGLTIVPRVHLSSNIGTIGLHTQGASSSHFRPYETDFEVRTHPTKIERNRVYDDYHYLQYLKKPPFFIRFWRRGIGFIKRHLTV